MLLCLGVTVLLGHAKIHDVNYISALRAWSANKKVVRLDIAVDEVLLVNGLHSRQLYLVSIRTEQQ